MSLKFLLLHYRFLGAFLKNIGIIIMELILIVAVVEDARKKFKEMCKKKIIFILNFIWKIKYLNHSEKFQNRKNRNSIPKKYCKINFSLI